jgi:hypothetical protein
MYLDIRSMFFFINLSTKQSNTKYDEDPQNYFLPYMYISGIYWM